MKLTVTEDYDEVELVDTKIRALVDLTRPFTTVIVMVITAVIAMAAIRYYELSVWDNALIVIYASATMGLVNICSNAINQAFDLEEDMINKPYRPIPRGILTKDDAIVIAVFAGLIAVIRAMFINQTVGLAVSIIVVGTMMYSMPPIRLKRLVVINYATIGILRGYMGPAVGWLAISGRYGGFDEIPVSIVHGLFFIALFVMFGTITKDINDVDGDRQAGVVTIPTMLGRFKAEILAEVGMFTALVGMAYVFIVQYNTSMFIYVIMFTIILQVFVTTIYHYYRERILDLENNVLWVYYYVALLILSIGLFVSV